MATVRSPSDYGARLGARRAGRLDIKRYGLWPIVEGARLLALRHGVARRSTAARIEGVRALGVGGESDLAAAVEAHERFLGLILRAQLADLAGAGPRSIAFRSRSFRRRSASTGSR